MNGKVCAVGMLLESLGTEAPLGLVLAQGLELVPPFLAAAGFGVSFVPTLSTEQLCTDGCSHLKWGLPGWGSLFGPVGSFATLKYRHQP